MPRSLREPSWSPETGGKRPGWMDPTIRQALIDGTRIGAPKSAVLKAARVSAAAFAEWQQQARLPSAPAELVELFEALDEAYGKAVMRNVGAIATAAQEPKHWRAAQFWLERMTDEFAPKRDEEAAPLAGATVVVTTPEDIRRLSESLQKRKQALDVPSTEALPPAGDG